MFGFRGGPGRTDVWISRDEMAVLTDVWISRDEMVVLNFAH